MKKNALPDPENKPVVHKQGFLISDIMQGALTHKALLLSLLFLFSYTTGFTQTNPVDKLDPLFRLLVDQSDARVSTQKAVSAAQLKVLPTKGFATRGGQYEERYDCIVYTKNAQRLRDNNIVLNSVLPDFVTAWATLEQLVQMAAMPEVSYVEVPKTNYLSNDVTVGSSGAALLHQGRLNNTIYKGKGVLVGIYDSGIDWDHFDFRDPLDTTKSRILRIWDQTITAITSAGEAPPSPFSYGVEFTQAQINDELDGTPANKVREKDINGHGTHVAGTAVGNGAALPSRRYTGMAPEADIVIIKGSDTTFDESRMIDGLTYLQNLANSLGKPAVMNWSIGSQFGPHDGTRAYEKAIDAFTASAAGRVVAVSAGNDNGSNIHNRLNLAANASGSFNIAVSDSTAPSVFSYCMYANNNSSVTITVTAPDGGVVTANPPNVVVGRVLNDSFTVVLINQIDPGNANRYLEARVLRTNVNTRRPTGTWTISITNNTANALTLDGWLYFKNDAFRATTLVGGNSDYLVGSPADATTAIAVASYAGKNSWYSNAVPGGYSYPGIRIDSISVFSSRGPRRDGLLKPEIAATGEEVVSCLSSDAASQFNNVFIAEKGLYAVTQGTSMASPGVAGAAALLLQANPNATAPQIKTLLTTAANKDGLTELVGPTPNPLWGYGRLDVYKAASLLFNCGPADRKTYKYDSSTRSGQESAYGLSTERMTLRFTADIAGKVGGVFFETNQETTSLVAEVKSSSGGLPGALLGSLNIDSGRIAKNAFNYIDLSPLNISVASGTDYYIVLYRAATSNTTWSLRYDDIVSSGRSRFSNTDGTSWFSLSANLKIRPVIYNNAQLAGTIATINSTDNRNINTSNQFINSNCQLISQVVPGGASPVSGVVTAKVWIEGTVPHYNGQPYVQRHYDVSSATTASSGRITLYFTQAEFSAFNTDAASAADLPAGPADANGIANLRIGKYGGNSTDGSGLIGTYTGQGSVINPADGDIVYNASAGRWEVSFDDTGFGGYFVQTLLYTLPVREEYFRGNTDRSANLLHWKISCTTAALLTIERSSNGIDFSAIGSIAATLQDCASPFDFSDAAPLTGNNYYRIKIVQQGENTSYTSTLLLQRNQQPGTKLFPTLVRPGMRVQINFGEAAGYLYVHDAVGKQVLTRSLTNGVQSIDLGLKTKGIYFYTIKTEQTILASGKIVVE